jgi:hypothetical protein
VNFLRIASRIISVDAPPDCVPFNFDGFHILEDDVKNSELSDALKNAFLEVFSLKRSISFHLNIMERYSNEKKLDKIISLKDVLLRKLSDLMELVKGSSDWFSSFDKAYGMLSNYEFPFELKNSHYIDMWIQCIHEFLTAMFSVSTKKLFRISTNISGKKTFAFGDKRPDGVIFRGIGVHVYDRNINDSSLDSDLKKAFLKSLSAKKDLQIVHSNLEGKPTEKGLERIAVSKKSVLKPLRELMDLVRSRLGKWLPKFDEAYQKLSDWDFPFDVKNLYMINIWIQQVHDLITALYIVCGGMTSSVKSLESVPEELKQVMN